MTKSKKKTVARRPVGYLLTETAIEAVHVEARKRKCWPNRVIESLIEASLPTKKAKVKRDSAAQVA